MNDENQPEFIIKSLGPTLRDMIAKTQENTLITLIVQFTKLRDEATADTKPGLTLTVDRLLSLLESHRDLK